MLEKITKLINFCTEKYAWLLSLLLKLNFVRLNKEKYTRKVIHRYYADTEEATVSKALETSLAEVLTDDQKDRQYKRLKHRFGLMVYLVSFLTCFPETLWGIVIACAIDIAFFQACLYMAMQRIMLIYSKAEDKNSDEDKRAQKVVAIESSGLMLGKYPLLQKAKSAVGWFVRQIVKRIGPKYIAKASKAVFIVLRRQGIKWFSIVIAKEHVDMLFSLVVPVTCATISGFVSVIIFIPMCNKLRKHLKRQAQAENDPQ